MNIYKCPQCGEEDNLHFNYDYLKQHRPVKDVLCNKCGEVFTGKVHLSELKSEDKRSTLATSIVPLSTIQELIRLYPNNQDLGEQIRKLYRP